MQAGSSAAGKSSSTTSLATALLACLLLLAARDAAAQAGDAARGEYIFHASGCASCHSQEDGKGPPLAGGVALKTGIGTFWTPNITPDPVHGIGKWSLADLRRALKEGKAPDGSDYYPAFPYTSYTGMSDADIADLYAYLKAQPASDLASKPHDLSFPFSIRFGLKPWKLLFFTAGKTQVQNGQEEAVKRGAYLAGSLAHCGECHTPRNFAMALKFEQWLAGRDKGVLGDSVPNITPDTKTGIGEWSESNIQDLLEDGSTPDGDRVGGDMAAEVKHVTSRLTPADRQAIARYLKSLPAIEYAPQTR
jgi:mono/diheme cytochrome c family protein